MTFFAGATNPQPRVLIVDDEERLSRFVSICLNRIGYETTFCNSVAEAENLLPSGVFSLVVTDLVMPDANGFALLTWMEENCPEVPAIVLTAHSTPGIVKQVAQSGAVALLKKPFSIQELYATVSEVIDAT
ncbi:MAG: response regulator [Caldilineaceae bacterium]|nr:response regulator [Caldilineaceae bacterium]HRJ45457.1 response regulator [Caldilineaceae bacterium]